MNINRKEFMLQGIFAFGRDIVRSLAGSSSISAGESSQEDYRYLQVDNSRCLAQKGGCFACIDHCPQEAVRIALGKGIAVDGELCDGCGECATVCPINPKVIEMKSQDVESINPMERRSE